jgi:hypothetical protein
MNNVDGVISRFGFDKHVADCSIGGSIAQREGEILALYNDNYRAGELIEAIVKDLDQNIALKRDFISHCLPQITDEEYEEHIRIKAEKIYSSSPLSASEQELIPHGFDRASQSKDDLIKETSFRDKCDLLLQLERGPQDKNHSIKPKSIADWLVREGFFSV